MGFVRSSAKKMLARLFGHKGASSGYEILSRFAVNKAFVGGWEDPLVAVQQHAAFMPLIMDLEGGFPRADFSALARAVIGSNIESPEIVELGCGSGWNKRVLERLYARKFSYTGLDCSAAMVDIGRREHPSARFVVGDAIATQFANEAFDIVISGTVLMHLANYNDAVAEVRRISKKCCIFHTVPIIRGQPTIFLKKYAYGQPTIEVIFNEKELLDLFAKNGLSLRQAFQSLDYDLCDVVGEHTKTYTYLCMVDQ